MGRGEHSFLWRLSLCFLFLEIGLKDRVMDDRAAGHDPYDPSEMAVAAL